MMGSHCAGKQPLIAHVTAKQGIGHGQYEVNLQTGMPCRQLPAGVLFDLLHKGKQGVVWHVTVS